MINKNAAFFGELLWLNHENGVTDSAYTFR